MAKRDVEAIQLRLQGKSYDEIARILGYKSKSGACTAVQRALDSVRFEAAEQLRLMQLQRCYALLDKVWEKAMGGSLPHIDRALAIMEKIDQYSGLSKLTSTANALQHISVVGVIDGERAVAVAQYIARQLGEDFRAGLSGLAAGVGVGDDAPALPDQQQAHPAGDDATKTWEE